MSRLKAIVLSSGGLDSTTLIVLAQDQGYDVYSLSFNYGQRHIYELKAAEVIAQKFQTVAHKVIDINLRNIGGSALTDDIQVPKRADEHVPTEDIPITYVPARNTIFLSYALAWAEVLLCDHIFIGVNQIDYSGYPDCRPEFIDSFQTMANLATKRAINGQTMTIHTPLLHLNKAEIIRKGHDLGLTTA